MIRAWSDVIFFRNEPFPKVGQKRMVWREVAGLNRNGWQPNSGRLKVLA